MAKEVQKGWGLILTEDSALSVPNFELALMVVIEHPGINFLGEYVPKKRIIHDLSFQGFKSNESINSRVGKSELEPIMSGHCLSKLIHLIISM